MKRKPQMPGANGSSELCKSHHRRREFTAMEELGLRGRVACFSLSWARTHLLRALWSSLHGVGVWVLEIRSTSGGSARVEGGQRPAALLPTEGQPWGWPRALGGGSWVGLGPRSNFLCLWTDRHLSRPQSVPCSVPLTSSEVLRYRRC